MVDNRFAKFAQQAQGTTNRFQRFATQQPETTAVDVVRPQSRQELLRTQADAQLAKERTENPALARLSEPGAAETVLRGIPVLGGFLDEATAALSSLANRATGGAIGKPYEEGLEYERARHRRDDAENPALNTVTKIIGGAAAAPVLPFIRGAGIVGGTAAGAATGALYGAGQGFAEGEGSFADRVDNAGDYAVGGAVLGGALPVAASAAQGAFSGARQVAPWVRARLPGGRADEIADNILAARIERSEMTPQGLVDELRGGQEASRFGANSTAQLPEMLADTSDSLQRLTGSVYRQGGGAGEVVRQNIERRQIGDPNRMSRDWSGDAGQVGQIEEATARALQLYSSPTARVTERQMVAQQKAESNRLYTQAREQSEAFDLQPVVDGVALRMQDYPPPFASQLQTAINLFTRPVNKGLAAREDAIVLKMQRLAEDEAEKLAAATSDDARANIENIFGKKQRRAMEDLALVQQQARILSAQRRPIDGVAQFDNAKKALDDMIDKAKRGGDGNLARELTGMKNMLLQRVHEPNAQGVPTKNLVYQEARDTFGSHAENREALELGRAALRENSEVSVEQFQSLTRGQQQLFRLGYLESLRNHLGSKRGGNDATLIFQEGRVADLMRAMIPNSQSRNDVFGDRSGRFGAYINRQVRMGQTRNRVLGNSATQQRGMDDADFAADALSRVMMGARGGLNAGLEVVGQVLQRVTGFRQDVALALARRLTETDPAQQAAILQRLQQQLGPQRFRAFTQEINRIAPPIVTTAQQPQEDR